MGTIRIIAAVIWITVLGASTLVAQAPPNDLVENATLVTTVPFTDNVDTTSAATEDWFYPCSFGTVYNTVWYKFIPSADMKVEFNTFGSSFDTSIIFYDEWFYPYNCNDDYAGTKQSRIQISVSGGQTYYIAVGSSAAAPGGGDLFFSVATVNPPANDDVSNAVSVGSLPFTYSENAFGATQSAGEPTPSCAYNGGAVWFAYDATYTGTLDVWTDILDGVVAAYTGSPEALAEVTGTWGAGGCMWWGGRLPLQVRAGTRYYIAVQSEYGATLGDVTVNFAVGPPLLQLGVSKLVGTVSPSSGSVKVSGVLTCNRAASFYLDGRLVQPLGKDIVQGTFLVDDLAWKDCAPGLEVPWSGTINYWADQHHAGRSSALFRAGKGMVTVHVGYADPLYPFAFDKEFSSSVALKAGSATK